LLEALAEAWREAEALWRQGFALIREAWLARAALIGESISVKLPAGERRGVMAGVDAEGRLLLNADNGRIVIDAGDVFPLG
jgi:BirA family biotin operon repressor/biotin-[acetyl-CoA-carboxylase] ligase